MKSQAIPKIVNGLFLLFGMSIMVSMAGLEIFGSLLMLTALVAGLIERHKLSFLKPFFIPFVFLFLTISLSLIVNQRWESFWFTLGWHRWFALLAATAYLFKYYKPSIQYFIGGLYAGLVISTVNGLIQFVTKYDFIRDKYIIYFADMDKTIVRVTSFFNMPTTYGYILSLFLFIPLSFVFSHQKIKFRWLHMGVAALATISLILTFTRGAWIGFLAGLALFLFLNSRKYFMAILIGGIILTVTLFLSHQGFKERVASLIDPTYYSNSQRIELWEANLQIFLDYPILGVGYNFNDVVISHYHALLDHNESFASHAHNNYLQFLAGTGLLGLIAFIVFLLSFDKELLRQIRVSTPENKTFLFALSSILVTFLVGMIFDCNFGDSEVRYSFLAYMALVIQAKEESSQVS